MRRRRLKLDPQEGAAVYHCMSRIQHGRRLLGDVEREVFRKQLWQLADFCGVEVLTYCVLENHFHLLVHVPRKSEISDEELVRRIDVLYQNDQPARAANVAEVLSQGGEDAQRLRDEYMARMGDISVYLGELKQRFSIWYNATHDTFGTLWAERFKSVLIEGRLGAVKTVAAYIDLNPVRAGFVDDPKDYRWSGYGEAVGGGESGEMARKGIQRIEEEKSWITAHNRYRMWLYEGGRTFSRSERRKGNADAYAQTSLSEADLEEVILQGGKLSRWEILRCQVRYFTDGGILGSEDFVREWIKRLARKEKGPYQMKGAEWDGLHVLTRLRANPFGFRFFSPPDEPPD